MWQDIRFAFRALALGIGANSAIFGAVNALIFYPIGISEPDRIVAIRVKYDKLNLKSISVSVPDFTGVRDSKDTFAAAAISRGADFSYTAGDFPERLAGLQVSSQWFDVFKAKPILGRVFLQEEDQPNTSQVVILAYPTFLRLFGGDHSIVERTYDFA